MQPAKWSAGVVLMMALSGCARFVPTDPYAPVWPGPAAAKASDARQPKPGAPGPQGPLTLQDCVAVALASNPDIGAGARAIDTAAAERDVAAADRWPTVHATGGYTHYLDNQQLVPPHRFGQRVKFTDDILDANLEVEMPIYTGGRITYQIAAADLLRRSAEHRLSRTRREVVFNVTSTFYAILAQRRVIDSLEFSRKTLEQHRKRVNDLLAAQKAARVDLLRTEVRLADLQEKLVRERNVLAVLHRTLANLLGRHNGPSPLTIRGELALAPAGADLAASLAKAHAGRADYQAARAELEAQAKQVDIARAAYAPTVSAMASYGRRWAGHAVIPQLGDRDSEDLGQVGLMVDVPLFEGGRLAAGVRRERSKLAEAQENLRKLELQIRLDVETAVLNVASNRERVLATEKAIEQAKESLRIEREKYGLGKGSITDVLDAQSALLDAQTSYYRALADYNTSTAQLRLAVGED